MSLAPDPEGGAPQPVVADPSPHAPANDDALRWTGPLGLVAPDAAAVGGARWADEEELAARLDLERAALLAPQHDLVAPGLLAAEPQGHVVGLVRGALAGLGGRGILVEAAGTDGGATLALVLAEGVARGLARRVLVVGPPGSAERTAADVAAATGLELAVARAAADPALGCDRVVLDHDLAEAQVDRLAAEPWDVVVVDAAHQVAGDDAAHVRGALARLLRPARWALLLTPVIARDDLLELRRLVELVRPGTFRPASEFRARLVDPDLPHTPSRPDELRRLLDAVVVATRPADRPPAPRACVVEHHEVDLAPEERQVMDGAVGLVAGPLAGPAGWEARRRLVPAVAQPGPALAAAAEAAAVVAPSEVAGGALRALAKAARAVGGAGPRARLLVTLVRLWRAEHGRVLVVAASEAHAAAVAEHLDGSDLAPLVLPGADAPAARAAVVAAWADRADAVLVATDAALAGVRLAGGDCLVCADLPWDPAVLDDRMAALGRHGPDLQVATFVAADTVDATVADVLAGPFELFGHGPGDARAVLAELDPATGPVADGEAPLSFADRLVVALTEDPDDVADALEDLDDDVEAARRRVKLLTEAAARVDGWFEATEAGGPDGVVGDETVSSAGLQVAVARWVRSAGGQVLDERPGLLQVDGAGLGPATWAFDRAAADGEPGAALVAPGSPALAALLARARAGVPVRATVAEPVDLPVVDAADHDPEVTLVDRLVDAPTTWSATATWRLRLGTGEESLVEVGSGTPPAGHGERRALDPGEHLPREVPASAPLVDQVVGDAAATMGDAAAEVERSARTAAEADRARLLVHHHAAVDAARAEIEETVPGTPEHDRATDRLRALHAEHPADGPLRTDALGGRARGELVALQVDVGDDFAIVERWRHRSGVEAEVRYPWRPDGVARRTSEVSGEPVDVLALCHDGHAVDRDELVACPSCGERGCAACGVARGLAACPTCGTEVCGRCRTDDDGRFGPCAGCRSPRRAHDEDTELARAWRLGGDALLLVGARWASLRVRADADPLVLVPDDDVHDPVRARLRAAADALGLPPDVGTGACPPGPRPLPGATDAWMATQPGATWKLVDDRGPDLAGPWGDFDGPDGPEPIVEPESAVEVVGLLASLREQEPPPPPPAFVRTPHVDVTRTTVTPSGLVRTTDRVAADGTCDRLDEEEAPLEAASGTDEHLFRPVAAARSGEVELVLARVHRSTVIRLTTPKATTERFVPAAPGLTFGGELAWASWVEEEGLPAGSVLLVDAERPTLEDADMAAPDAPRLQRRAVVDVWGATPIDELAEAAVDGATAATDEDLALVGYDEVPDLAMDPAAGGEADLAAALHERGCELDEHPAPPHLLAHRWFEVEEAWQGRAAVRLAYKVAPGEPAWPRLDDTHQRAADFEVDDHGHLHEPGTGWHCLACGEHHCRACGPVGAMDDCGTCAQPACGLCRARTRRAVPEQRCDRCGARSCDDCGRVPDARRCTTCRRSVCAACRVGHHEGSGPSCVACSRLRPALEAEVDALPEVLGAHGLHVEVGQHATEVSVVLAGSWRDEVVVLQGGQVAWWVHHDEVDPATRALLLAAARRWDLPGDLAAVCTGWTVHPEVEGPHLLLVGEEVPEVRWSLELDGHDEATAGSPSPPRVPPSTPDGRPHAVVDAVDASVADAVVAEVAPHSTALPVPAPTDAGDSAPACDHQRRERRRLDPGGRLVVEDRRRASATWLTPGGLQRVVSEGDEDRRTTAPWQVGVRFGWMAEGWEPEPDVVAYALLGELEAALVRVGRHLCLGVRGDDRVVWWTLRDVPGDLQRCLLGEHLTGEERVLDLRVVTDPGKVDGPTVVEATFIERRIEPVLEQVDPGTGDPEEALRAAAAWVRRTAAFPSPTGPPLPDELAAALVAQADELRPPVLETVGIALQVVETWRQGIDAFPVPYRLAPGSTEGTVVCADSQVAARLVRRDRSGHLVAEATACPSCGERSCGRCHVPVRPCTVCAEAVCARCALDDGRCPLCAALVPVDRKEAKRLGLKVGRRAVVLRAEAGDRRVVAVRDGAWSVTVAEGAAEAAPPPDDGRAPLLDRLAAGGEVASSGAAAPS